MAFIAPFLPIISAIGTAVSVISALNQGESQSSASNYNAQVSEQNATIARQQAVTQAVVSQQQSDVQVRQTERENYLRLGMIRANQGASGGAGDAGSVLDVLGDVAAQGEYERQQIVYQGELSRQQTTYQGELSARGYTNTATLDTYSGNAAKTSSYMKAGSELLGGGLKTYDIYGKLKRA